MAPEVEELLAFADSEAADRLIDDVMAHDLPADLESLVEESLSFEWTRDRFMWQWVHYLAPQNTLPCVEPAYRDEVPTDKTLAVLFITLLDDVLEKRRDHATFEEAAKIPFEHRRIHWEREGLDQDYVDLAQRVWHRLVDRIHRGPLYDTYRHLFDYDVKQAINAIDYSDFIITHPGLATLHDLELYQSHNMAMFVYADIDLMHSPAAVEAELPTLRSAIWSAQQMARIGNWVSTWRRELAEGDYSSGVLVYALEENITTPAELQALAEDPSAAARERLVERIETHDVERKFLRRWHRWRQELVATNEELDTVDLTPFIEGLETVLRLHLASRGLK
jgi:hypothetical protein